MGRFLQFFFIIETDCVGLCLWCLFHYQGFFSNKPAKWTKVLSGTLILPYKAVNYMNEMLA